jgi:ribonucleoside-diphosphate reductase beta chain
MKSFNKNNIDFTKEYMFFGETPNVSRFDVQRFEIFKQLYIKQLGFFWKPDEIDLSKDSKDFKHLPQNEQHIFIKNLLFQTFLDSVQSRSPQSFMPHVSNPEIESMITLWSMFESLHSFSYSWIIQNVFSNPTEVLNQIMTDFNILNRADSVTSYYDDFMKYSLLYQVFGEGRHNTKDDGLVNISLRELKRKLLLCMASVNVLEGVRFYASFACSFAFAERGLMEGNAKIITFIARDENLHLAFTQNILKKWANGEDDPEMAELFVESLPIIEKMYIDCVKQETEWADYLFKDGPMLGLTKPILCEYVKHIAGKRMRTIGIKNDYPVKNPITWTDKYLIGSNVQVAPQEVEISSYVVGGVKHDIRDGMFSNLLT